MTAAGRQQQSSRARACGILRCAILIAAAAGILSGCGAMVIRRDGTYVPLVQAQALLNRGATRADFERIYGSPQAQETTSITYAKLRANDVAYETDIIFGPDGRAVKVNYSTMPLGSAGEMPGIGESQTMRTIETPIGEPQAGKERGAAFPPGCLSIDCRSDYPDLSTPINPTHGGE